MTGVRRATFRLAVTTACIVFGGTTPPTDGDAAEAARGVLAGEVVHERTGRPVDFGEFMLHPGRRVERLDRMGRFRIENLAPGLFQLTMLCVGMAAVDTAVEIAPGQESRLTIAVHEVDRDPAAASRESVGVEAQLAPGDLEWRIRPARRRSRVGEHPDFTIRAVNRSRHTMRLPRSLDGSEDGMRHPRLSIRIVGPEGGFAGPGSARCGNTNATTTSDFVEVRPGERFDPYERGFGPKVEQLGTFQKPGHYRAVFHYSTGQPDARRWIGWPGPERSSEAFSRILRFVPLIDDSCAVEFEVRP